MARRKRGLAPEDDEPVVDISSLIDVCFLLLIYFIVTSTIAEKETDLVLRLPSDSPSSESKPDIDPALFVISADGAITEIDTTRNETILASEGKGSADHRLPSELPDLNQRIKLYHSIAGEDAMVQVKAHPDAKSQYVIDLLNVLVSHGITKITFTQHSAN